MGKSEKEVSNGRFLSGGGKIDKLQGGREVSNMGE